MTRDLDATIIDAMFRAILNDDTETLENLRHKYPHLTVVPPVRRVITHNETMMHLPARVHICRDAHDGLAFTVESQREDIARWVGMRFARDEGFEVTWHGTQRVAGNFVAQFTKGDSW